MPPPPPSPKAKTQRTAAKGDEPSRQTPVFFARASPSSVIHTALNLPQNQKTTPAPPQRPCHPWRPARLQLHRRRPWAHGEPPPSPADSDWLLTQNSGFGLQGGRATDGRTDGRTKPNSPPNPPGSSNRTPQQRSRFPFICGFKNTKTKNRAWLSLLRHESPCLLYAGG